MFLNNEPYKKFSLKTPITKTNVVLPETTEVTKSKVNRVKKPKLKNDST